MESPGGPRRLDEGPHQVTRDRETKSSLLQYHLGLFNDILQVQPQRHTEQQLKLEREKKKRQMLEDEHLELEKIRLKYQIENHGSKGEKKVPLFDDEDFEKKRQEMIKRQRDREKQRNEEENILILDKRKEKRNKACKLKWFEKEEVKRSSEEKTRVEQAKRHVTDNVWMKRKEQQEKRKEELHHLTPKDAVDEELMFKKALELSKMTSKDTSARPKIFHSKGIVRDLPDECESIWDMKPAREVHDTGQQLPQPRQYDYASAVSKSLDKYGIHLRQSNGVGFKSGKTLTQTVETEVQSGFNSGRQISFGRGSGVTKQAKGSLEKGCYSTKDASKVKPTDFGTDQSIKRKQEFSNTDENTFKNSKISGAENKNVISGDENWHRESDDWYAYPEYIDGLPFPKATFVESKKVKSVPVEVPQISNRPKPCNVSSKDGSYTNKKGITELDVDSSGANVHFDEKERSMVTDSHSESVVKEKRNSEMSAISWDQKEKKAQSCQKRVDSILKSEATLVQDYITNKKKVPLLDTTEDSTVETMDTGFTSLTRNDMVEDNKDQKPVQMQKINEKFPVGLKCKESDSNRKDTGVCEELDQTPGYPMSEGIVGENDHHEKMSDPNHNLHGPYQTVTESRSDVSQAQKFPCPNTFLTHFYQAYFQYQQQTAISTEQYSTPGTVSYSQNICNKYDNHGEHSTQSFPDMKGLYGLESFYPPFGINLTMAQVFDMMKNYHIIQDEQMNPSQNSESISKPNKDSNLESPANLPKCEKSREPTVEKERMLCKVEDQNSHDNKTPKKDYEPNESDMSSSYDACHTSAIRLKGRLGTSADSNLRMPKLPAVASQFTKKNLKSLKIDPSICKASKTRQREAEDKSQNSVNISHNDIKQPLPIRSPSLQSNNFSTYTKDPCTARSLLEIQETSQFGNKNDMDCNSAEGKTDEECGWIETGDISNAISNKGILNERAFGNNRNLDQTCNVKATDKEAALKYQQDKTSEKNNGDHEVHLSVRSKLDQDFHSLVAKEYGRKFKPLETVPVAKEEDAVYLKTDLYEGCESTAEQNLRIRNMIRQMRDKENLAEESLDANGGSRKRSY